MKYSSTKIFHIFLSTIIAVSIGSSAVFSADNESLYNQGIEAFNSGNYGSAELIFQRIIDTKDDDFIDQAWFYLAKSIFYQEKALSVIYVNAIAKNRSGERFI